MTSRDTDPCLHPESETPTPGEFESERALQEMHLDRFCTERAQHMRMSEDVPMVPDAQRELLQVVAARLETFGLTLDRVESRSEEMADWRIAHDGEHKLLIARLGGLEQHRSERILIPAIMSGGAMAVAVVALVAFAWLAGRLGSPENVRLDVVTVAR